MSPERNPKSNICVRHMELEILRVLVCLPFLAYACYTDLRTRRVSNRVWLVMIVVGAALALYELLRGDYMFLLRLVLATAFIYAVVYLLFRIRAFGGADAKSIIAISVVLPMFPELYAGGYYLPLLGIPGANPFPFSVLANAAVITLIAPISFIAYNLAKLDYGEVRRSLPLIAIGYKAHVKDVGGKNLKLIETYEPNNGGFTRALKLRGIEIDDEVLNNLRSAAGDDAMVWVTPIMPFMMSITAGFLLAVTCGDVLFTAMKIVLM